MVSKLKRKLKGFVSHNTEKYAKGLLKVLRHSHFSFLFSQFNWSWHEFVYIMSIIRSNEALTLEMSAL